MAAGRLPRRAGALLRLDTGADRGRSALLHRVRRRQSTGHRPRVGPDPHLHPTGGRGGGGVGCGLGSHPARRGGHRLHHRRRRRLGRARDEGHHPRREHLGHSGRGQSDPLAVRGRVRLRRRHHRHGHAVAGARGDRGGDSVFHHAVAKGAFILSEAKDLWFDWQAIAYGQRRLGRTEDPSALRASGLEQR